MTCKTCKYKGLDNNTRVFSKCILTGAIILENDFCNCKFYKDIELENEENKEKEENDNEQYLQKLR
jgi:hypothetical protein